jgi:hypothetical protein
MTIPNDFQKGYGTDAANKLLIKTGYSDNNKWDALDKVGKRTVLHETQSNGNSKHLLQSIST